MTVICWSHPHRHNDYQIDNDNDDEGSNEDDDHSCGGEWQVAARGSSNDSGGLSDLKVSRTAIYLDNTWRDLVGPHYTRTDLLGQQSELGNAVDGHFESTNLI